MGAVLVCGIAVSCTRGVWLDEFWSLRLSDAALPLRRLYGERWLHDTNPVWANLLYRLAAASGAEAIPALRLVLNLPALLLFVATTALTARDSPSRSPFYLVFAVLVLALPAFNSALSDYRSFFWQLCMAAMLLQYIHWLLVEPQGHQPSAVTALGMVGLFGSIVLHFVGGLITSTLVALLLLELARRGRWADAGRLAVPAVAAWASMLLFAFLQYREVGRELDYSWIATDTPLALQFAGSVLLGGLLANPAATGLALLMREGDRPQRRFILLLAAAILASALLLLAANSLKPLIVDRYLLAWQPMLCACIAAAGAKAIVAQRWRLIAVLACAALAIPATAVRQAREVGWNGTRDHIAAAVRRCPSSPVYAMSPWRLTAARDSRAARFEDAVFEQGYRSLAREGGFRVRMVSPQTRVLGVPAGCPLLLWVEHTGGHRFKAAPALLADAGLGFAQRAQTRLFSTADGFVVTAQRAPSPSESRHGE